MKICRFDNDRLGIVEGDEVLDVTAALAAIPEQRWPLAQGDPFILNFRRVLAAAKKLAPKAKRKPLATVKLLSPVPNPGEDHRRADQLQRPHRRIDQGPGHRARPHQHPEGHRRVGPVPQGRLLAHRLRRGDTPALARPAQRPRGGARARHRQARQQDPKGEGARARLRLRDRPGHDGARAGAPVLQEVDRHLQRARPVAGRQRTRSPTPTSSISRSG